MRHAQACEGGAAVLERGVIRREDGNVLMRVDERRQRGVGDRATRRGEVKRGDRAREVRGWDEERVDGVDDATYEGNVLGLENGRG